MKVFLDSSALAKRYIMEPGTAEVLSVCAKADEIILSSICAVEIVSAFSRRRREGGLSSAEYKVLKKNFAGDLKGATIVELYPEIVKIAVQCLEKSPVRSLDAIHVACGVVCECDLFVSSDLRQLAAARKLKLNCLKV